MDEDAVATLAAALADDRSRAAARLAAATREVERIVADAVATPPDDEHDPDGATIGFERAQASHLRDDAAARLAALDVADARLAAGTSAVCDVCDRSIPIERLLARPVTTRCVTHA